LKSLFEKKYKPTFCLNCNALIGIGYGAWKHTDIIAIEKKLGKKLVSSNPKSISGLCFKCEKRRVKYV
jgi:hypothetical protein